ncbi:MAG: RNA-binding cell elongation regulator Jag/EloR [Chloroflexota bacterium]
MSDHYEFEGKTVDDAVARGLIELGLSRELVTINVVRKGSRGLFGIGSESAIVQLVPHSVSEEVESGPVDDGATKSENVATDSATFAPTTLPPAPAEVEPLDEVNDRTEFADPVEQESHSDLDPSGTDPVESPSVNLEDVDGLQNDIEDESGEWGNFYEELDEVDREVTKMAVYYVDEILHLMGYDCDVEATWQEPEPDEVDACLLLDVYGDDLDRLRNGDTINSLQYLLRLMINQKIRAWRNIVVDVNGYKAKRGQQLNQIALRMAEQVIESGRALSLEPMPANERRLVHLALRDHPEVYTESSGDSDRRKVHILPKSLL